MNSETQCPSQSCKDLGHLASGSSPSTCTRSCSDKYRCALQPWEFQLRKHGLGQATARKLAIELRDSHANEVLLPSVESELSDHTLKADIEHGCLELGSPLCRKRVATETKLVPVRVGHRNLTRFVEPIYLLGRQVPTHRTKVLA